MQRQGEPNEEIAGNLRKFLDDEQMRGKKA
jgi:hypothetical protein